MFRTVLISAISIAVVYSDLWASFKKKFDKHYGPQEEPYRRKAFDEKCARIAENNLLHDLGLAPYRMGLNYYSDWPWEDFRNQMLMGPEMINLTSNVTSMHKPSGRFLPHSFDWKERGFESRVKDQKHCAASFAFAAAGGVEFRYFKILNQNIDLSAQQILDCSGNGNCRGGSPAMALEYITENQGLCTEENYPYSATQHAYCAKCDPVPYSIINGYIEIDPDRIDDAVVYHGPVIAQLAVTPRMIDYIADEMDVLVMGEPCIPNEAGDNQIVLVVGYGRTPKGQDYWHIKNSWGESWGYQGYVKIARHRGQPCENFRNPIYVW